MDVRRRCVGHVDMPPVLALSRILPRMLPADIAIRGIAAVPYGFDTRVSELERFSVYRIADASSRWPSFLKLRIAY
jgi:Pseudouridylate synthase